MKVALRLTMLALLLGGAAHAGEDAPPAVLDAVFGDERRTVALEELEQRPALGPGESIRAVEIARDANSSHHVVAIRDGETPHRHDRHDLLVMLLEGHGVMRMGDAARRVGQGSIVWVPRGTVHAFRNASDAPAVAYIVYSPAFDADDRIVEED
jgi:quercetin dioxygenase-like cupin family protein